MVHILWDLKQGSEEWLEIRKSFITATDAFDLLNGVAIKDILSKKQNPSNFTGSRATDRGHLLEPEARNLYAELNNVDVREAGGIINSKYPNAWISPDGVVGEDGLIEIKSFEKNHHEDVIQNLDPHLIAQIQFQLFVSEREWVDFVAYNPEETDITKAFFVKRFYPDKEIHQKLNDLLSNQDEDPLIEETALTILKLENELQQIPEQIQAQIKFYFDTKRQIESLKNTLKIQTKGKVQKTLKLGGNKLDLSIYDTNKVSVEDESLVPDEYTTTVQVDNITQTPDGKFYQKVPNTKLVSNLYKAGKSLPSGFKVKKSRTISIKFNGQSL